MRWTAPRTTCRCCSTARDCCCRTHSRPEGSEDEAAESADAVLSELLSRAWTAFAEAPRSERVVLAYLALLFHPRVYAAAFAALHTVGALQAAVFAAAVLRLRPRPLRILPRSLLRLRLGVQSVQRPPLRGCGRLPPLLPPAARRAPRSGGHRPPPLRLRVGPSDSHSTTERTSGRSADRQREAAVAALEGRQGRNPRPRGAPPPRGPTAGTGRERCGGAAAAGGRPRRRPPAAGVGVGRGDGGGQRLLPAKAVWSAGAWQY